MSAPSSGNTPSKSEFDYIIEAKLFIEKEQERAMAMFQAAVLEMRGTHTSNPKIIDGKKALYAAKTVADFRAVHLLFQNTTTRNRRISEGKRLIKVAAEICDEADNARKQAKVLYAADCASAAAAAGPAVAAAGPATSPPRAAAQRVVLSAPAKLAYTDKSSVVLAAGGAAQRIVLSAPAPPSYIDTSNVVLAAGGAGTKRPAADVILISDDEDEPCKPRDVKTEAAGGIAKAAKLAPEQLKPGQLPAFDFTRKYWHREVHNLIMQLRERKIYDVMKMSDEALDELRTLPVKAAMMCLLDVLGARERIGDVNAFVVDKARSHRFRDSLPDARTILKEMGVSDEDSDSSGQAADAGCMAKDNAAEKAPAKVVFAYDHLDDTWESDFIDSIKPKKANKLFRMLRGDAEDELKTLPIAVATECIGNVLKSLDEEPEIDVNEFFVQEAQKLRETYGIEDMLTIFEMWMDERPADDEPSADDEPKSAPAGGVAKSPDAAGKAAKVVYAANDGQWHDDVYKMQNELQKIGKFNSSELNVEAKNELRTLPYEVALILFGKIRDETTKIADMNAFIVSLAQKLRKQWGLDDAKTILREIEPETVEDTESEQDDAGDAEAGSRAVYTYDSDGHSIEY